MAETSISSRTKLEDRIVRYADLAPCYDAFIDTRTPGSDRKENFTIIGPGVSENPNQHVHIAEPHGFNIGGARQPPHCTNSQHSHETVEVFYVHTGQWRFDLGEHGDDAQITLAPGDLISIPTNVFRGFTNVGDADGFLWAVLGGDDPGHVLWAPKVFDMARDYGLVLLEDGMLVDTSKNETIPTGKRAMSATTPAQVNDLDVYTNEQLAGCVIRSGEGKTPGGFHGLSGVTETELIGRSKINWAHGFTLSEIDLVNGAEISEHTLSTADVYFVQSGEVCVSIDDEEATLVAGDTITFPERARRRLKNRDQTPARLVAVRGGDQVPEITWV